jgi:hypothetical protein
VLPTNCRLVIALVHHNPEEYGRIAERRSFLELGADDNVRGKGQRMNTLRTSITSCGSIQNQELGFGVDSQS